MSLATHLTPRIKLSRPRSVIEPLEARIAPAAVVSLDGLNGQNGFKIIGAKAGNFAGASVSSAGDINGDGFDDIILTAPDADNNSDAMGGAAYIIFGKAGGFKSPFNLENLNGANGFKISPGSFSYNLDVSAGGDINGDGLADLLVATSDGYETADPLVQVPRGVTVLFGKILGFASLVDLAHVSASAGFGIVGSFVGSTIVPIVTAVGDFNGDGFDDAVVSGVNSASYLLFGKASFGSTVDLTALDGIDGFRIEGAYTYLSGLGDFNGDGKADIAFANPMANSGEGAAYVVFGRAVEASASFDVQALNGSNGFTIHGSFEREIIVGVNTAGDFNGDGLADLFVETVQGDTGEQTLGYLFTGTSGIHTASVTLDAGKAFLIQGSNYTPGLLTVGDFNGDGYSDLIVGGSKFLHGRKSVGETYVVFGNDYSFDSTVVNKLRPSEGFAIQGGSSFEGVIGAGDVNGDGFDDILIGNPLANGHGTETGAAYVIFGHAKKSPPVTISNEGHTATYHDSFGNLVTVQVSAGHLIGSDLRFDADQNLILNLTRQGFTGADVSIFSAPGRSAFVSDINATGIDLGKVAVSGGLSEIEAGSGKFDSTGKISTAIELLNVESIGGNSLSSSPESRLVGSLGHLNIGVAMFNSSLEVVGDGASIGSIELGSRGAIVFSDGTVLSMEGLIQAEGNIGDVTIRHDVLGGSGLSGIIAGGKLGLVKVGGSIVGDDASNPVIISALGNLGAKTAAGAVAIAGIRVAGDVTNAEFLAGYNAKLGAANPNASIGKVKVGGNWTASSVVAGIADTSTAGDLVSAPDGFGQHDSLIAGDTNYALVARIASITIQGTATGSSAAGAFYGLTAQQIGAVNISGEALALTTGPDGFGLDDVNGNFRLVEVDA